MADLLEKEWVWIQIVNVMTPKNDLYVAIPTYSGTPILPQMLIANLLNGGEPNPNSAVYDLVKLLKELASKTFDLAKENGHLKGLSFDDIK